MITDQSRTRRRQRWLVLLFSFLSVMISFLLWLGISMFSKACVGVYAAYKKESWIIDCVDGSTDLNKMVRCKRLADQLFDKTSVPSSDNINGG